MALVRRTPLRRRARLRARTPLRPFNPATRRRDTAWRAAVLDRDGGTCRRCGSTSGVEAHHVYPRDTHPQHRWNPDVGAALCAPCHRWVHRHQGDAHTAGWIKWSWEQP